MILKHVYLTLNLDEFPDTITTPFGFRTRYMCNYLERRLRTERFRAEGFNRVVVAGCSKPSAECILVPDNTLLLEVSVDVEKYQRLTADELHEYFAGLLRTGLSKCATDIPLDTLVESLEHFRGLNYVNTWTHASRWLPGRRDRVSLECELTMDEFVLRLQVERGGDIKLSRPILRTKPDEIIFHPQFKDLKLTATDLVVTTRFTTPDYGAELLRMPLADIQSEL